ncbi:hypothetical protein LIHA111178_07970 [Litorimonas haliclonae]
MAFSDITTPDYWDCECPTDYVHRSFVSSCHLCGALREEQPDSRRTEVDQLETV